jgi:hypothetical protein
MLVEAPRFDRFAKSFAVPRSRRGAFISLLSGALALVAVPGAELSDTTAATKKLRSRRKQGERKDNGVVAQGPCGNGGPKHNSCKRHAQCCTGYCDRKNRCRCRRVGDSCTEDRNCCPERQGATCQDGVCRLAPGGECVPGEIRACYSGPAGTENVGTCRSGVQTCSASQTWGACAGEVLPQVETCNGLDDDCDGLVDEGAPCPSAPNAIITCVAGSCQSTCAPGFADCDGNAANGCEADLLTNGRNCGGCGIDCGLCPDGTPGECFGGSCVCGGILGR